LGSYIPYAGRNKLMLQGYCSAKFCVDLPKLPPSLCLCSTPPTVSSLDTFTINKKTVSWKSTGLHENRSPCTVIWNLLQVCYEGLNMLDT
ncbi:mCG145913, partial [Mus musculus]